MQIKYIIDIPYKNKCFCKEIGLQVNKISSITILILCLNKTNKKIIFYFESEEKHINEIISIQKKMTNIFTIHSGKYFWELVSLKEWVIYTVIEGMEKYNSYMIQKLLDDL